MSLANQCLNTAQTTSNIAHLHQPSPTAILKPISHGNTIILLKNHFVLAQNNQIQCQFYLNANNHWYCQYGEHHFELQSGMVLALDGQIWQFERIQTPSKTHQQPTTQMNFDVSCDEEHISLSINHQGQHAELGERVHHYPLLLLARQFQQDQQANFDHNNCGWLDVEQLTSMIGIDSPVLNVQLHRAKQQITKVLPDHKLIERRAGQVRLNCGAIKINKGQQHINRVIA